MSRSNYKKKMLSLIVTVFNEAETIENFLVSCFKQTLLFDELIIVDASSTDATVNIIKNFAKKHDVSIRLFIREGNRSVGRNFAVKKSRGQWLAISDAGCILDKNWLKALSAEQNKTQTQVVAGYYQGLATSAFGEASVPYFLVMPDRIQRSQFLPATRSMLIEKSLWEKLGGLNEKLDYNEDYQFARRLKNLDIKIAFSEEARVYWLPPRNILDFCQKIFNFARGDAFAGLIRKKVYLIFLRYLIFFGILIFFPNFYLIFSLMGIYLLWAIIKNMKYCPRSFFYLPLLQLLADGAVMLGSGIGLIQAIFNKA